MLKKNRNALAPSIVTSDVLSPKKNRNTAMAMACTNTDRKAKMTASTGCVR